MGAGGLYRPVPLLIGAAAAQMGRPCRSGNPPGLQSGFWFCLGPIPMVKLVFAERKGVLVPPSSLVVAPPCRQRGGGNRSFSPRGGGSREIWEVAKTHRRQSPLQELRPLLPRWGSSLFSFPVNMKELSPWSFWHPPFHTEKIAHLKPESRRHGPERDLRKGTAKGEWRWGKMLGVRKKRES